MRYNCYKLQRLKENEIAGPKTANALIDFCLGMSTTSKYLTISPNGRGSINFDFNASELLANAISEYVGAFSMNTRGVEAGTIVVNSAGGGTLAYQSIPATRYSSMSGSSTGVVTLCVTWTGSAISWWYEIVSSPTARNDCWTFAIGIWDGETPVQLHYGEAVGWYGEASSTSYTGPFALSKSSGSSVVTVAQGTVYAGLNRIVAGGGTVNALTGDYVILTITPGVSATSYSSSLSASGSLPTQTAGSYSVPLGHVISGGLIEQWQYGPVFIAGRVV